MKKFVKLFLKHVIYISLTILLIVILDNVQAKIFSRSPLFRTRTTYFTTRDYSENPDHLHYMDKGVFVIHYKYEDGSTKTIFSWEEDNK